LIPFCYQIQAQKNYDLNIVIQNIDTDSIEISINDGVEIKDSYLSKRKNHLEGVFLTKYASFQVFHPRSSNLPPAYEFGFFVGEQPASIVLSINKRGDIELIDSNSVITFKELGEDELLDYTKDAYDDFWAFFHKNVSQFGRNDSITALGFELNAAHNRAITDAVSELPPTYYNFWRFRTQIARNPDVTRTRKEEVLKNNFSKFEETYDYKLTEELIFGADIKPGEIIENFKAKDIMDDEIVELKNIPEQVLLVSWATWCAPCIRKMSTLKEISKKYDDVKLVYINHDKDIKRVKKLIESKELDGIHLSYDDTNIPFFLRDQLIPKIYLLNNDLRVQYSYDSEPDTDLERLKKVLAEQTQTN